MRLRLHTSQYIVLLAALASGCHRHAPEPSGASTNAPSPTREGDPEKPMASSFAGFRMGEPVEEAKRKCVASGHAIEDEHKVTDYYRDVRCEGVPVPEPGIDGDYVELSVCGAAICEISVFRNTAPAAAYQKALATLTGTYGKPNELVSTAPADEDAAVRGCAGAAELTSATWLWDKGNAGKIDVSLNCLDGSPWVSLTVLDAAGVGRYRSMATDD